MRHRIAAGTIVVESGSVLMVNHRRPGIYDYWVGPGGGAVGLEGLPATAARETLEETGLVVEVDRLAYVEEMASPEYRQIKFWASLEFRVGNLASY